MKCCSRFRILAQTAAAVLVLLSVGDARAHTRSIADAYLLVSEKKATLRLKTTAEDLWHFHKLKPDAFDKLLPAEIDRAIKLHSGFLVENLKLSRPTGQRLPGKVTRVRRFVVPKEGIAVKSLSQYRLQFDIEYRFQQRPAFLAVKFDVPKELAALAEVNFRIKTDIGDRATTVLLPGRPVTARLAWEAGKRPHLTIGTAPVHSFLYIEHNVVRHELLFPLAALEPLVALPRRDPASLSISEQNAVRDRIGKYLAESNPITVNGDVIKSQVERVSFFPIGTKDYAKAIEPSPVSILNGRVGVILAYRSELPTKVMVDWTLFHEELPKAFLLVRVNRKLISHEFTPESPTFRWQGTLQFDEPVINPVPVTRLEQEPVPIPWALFAAATLTALALLALVILRSHRILAALAVLLSASGTAFTWHNYDTESEVANRSRLDTSNAPLVLKSLLKNTYASFAAGEEKAIYDRLAKSASGELLRELYFTVKRSRFAEEQGGANAEIVSVELTQSTPPVSGENGFSSEVTWRVAARIEHWGHVHDRVNEYRARLEVSAIDDFWKLTAVDIISEAPVEPPGTSQTRS